jgi:hypothetical protein
MAEQIDSAPEWRVIPSFPDYEASSDGQIRRRTVPRAKPNHFGPGYVKKTDNKGGYLYCAMTRPGWRGSVTVHRLVCEAFHGPAPSSQHQVAHSDCNRLNNSAANLRWATQRENAQDTIRLGRQARGERSAKAKLTAAQVTEIKRRRAAGEPYHRLGAQFSVSPQAIFHIARGQNWKHIPE